jgi:phosphate transport system permease protein
MTSGHRLPASCVRLAALVSGILIIAVFVLMLVLGWPLLTSGQFVDLLTQPWQPLRGIYGIAPMIAGSMFIALLGLVFSLPISLGTAFIATVLAPPVFRKIVMWIVRFMAGVPTVVYGFVAVFLLVPFMREQITGRSGFNICSAALMLAVLIAPTMVAFFVMGINSIPEEYCQAVDALGGRPVQKLLYLILPHTWPALVSGTVMGLGRAMGDTLISLMVAGNSIAVPNSIRDSARTLTAHIALVIAADFDSMEFKSIFACGLILYGFTFLIIAGVRLAEGNRKSRDHEKVA